MARRMELGSAWTFSVLVVVALAGLALEPAGAQAEPQSTPERTWVTDGAVTTVAAAGGTIYIGGEF